MKTATAWAESTTPVINFAKQKARETRRVWYVPWGSERIEDATMTPDKRQSRYAVRPNGVVEWQTYDAKINGIDPGWGKPWGGDGPHWVTDRGVLVTMFRNGQKVRFYDQEGNQVGPEQRNVAPAVAFALHYRWTDFHDIVKMMIKENPNTMVQARLIARVATRHLLGAYEKVPVFGRSLEVTIPLAKLEAMVLRNYPDAKPGTIKFQPGSRAFEASASGGDALALVNFEVDEPNEARGVTGGSIVLRARGQGDSVRILAYINIDG